MTNELTEYLRSQPAGEITDTASLESLLARRWPEFSGDDAGMHSHKLLGRMEDVIWDGKRILTFRIERHGGTVMGSSRAEMQQWRLDLVTMTATCEIVGHLQLRPMQPRLNVGPLADEIVGLVVNGSKDERLKWQDADQVRVLIGKVLPAGSACKQTLTGRRRRFRAVLIERLGQQGWVESDFNLLFEKEATG